MDHCKSKQNFVAEASTRSPLVARGQLRCCVLRGGAPASRATWPSRRLYKRLSWKVGANYFDRLQEWTALSIPSSSSSISLSSSLPGGHSLSERIGNFTALHHCTGWCRFPHDPVMDVTVKLMANFMGFFQKWICSNSEVYLPVFVLIPHK